MAEPQETPWHRAMTPPPYLAQVDLDAPRWDRPIQSRAAELDEYERHRSEGGPRNPDLEHRLIKRRHLQVLGHIASLGQ